MKRTENRGVAWWRNEDWLAVIVATALITAVVAGWDVRLPSLAWTGPADIATAFSSANLEAIARISLVLILLATAVLAPGLGLLNVRRLPALAGGIGLMFLLGWLAIWMAAHSRAKAIGIEYVIWALAIGMLWRQVLPVPSWLSAAIRTEFYIKVGIVILGCGILFPELLKAGVPGLIQAALVIPVVWQATFRLARRLGVDDEFGVMISSAVSICGVSAAIAACGAIDGDKRKLSYVTSVILLCAVPMMLLMPWCARLLQLTPEVAGAWLGGTLDTTGSVLAATEQIGDAASRTGTVVKLSQNVFIGIAALAISLWWTMRDGRDATAAPGLGILWERFPKFVLGFIAASLAFSFLLQPQTAKSFDKPLKALREIWFAAAFVSIGLETRCGELFKLGGGRPALAFLGGQAVNILWTLLLAMLLFGGWLWPA